MSYEIRARSVLPSRRVPLQLQTDDGLSLVGEAALPVDQSPRATLVCVHPLPTHGGMMDSHLFIKAAARLPALAQIAVVRFNTRGTSSHQGTSEGHFDRAEGEGADLRAAMDWCAAEQLPLPWQVGWSFGTDVVLKHGLDRPSPGAILLSPPARWSTVEDLQRWSASRRQVVILVPERDDFLPPEQARHTFAPLSQAQIEVGVGARHLWVGERWVRWVFDAIVATVAPDVPRPLPETWPEPMPTFH